LVVSQEGVAKNSIFVSKAQGEFCPDSLKWREDSADPRYATEASACEATKEFDRPKFPEMDFDFACDKDLAINGWLKLI
jgi:hypothetical protein